MKSFRDSTALTLAALFAVAPALAQPAPAPAETPAAAAGTPAAAKPAAPVVITDKARQHFRACVNYLQDPDGARYEAAYQECQAAYAESPSWKILGNLGIATMKLERTGEAIGYFEQFLDGGGAAITGDERAQFERDLETQKTSVVWVTIETVPGATVVDERIPTRGGKVVNTYHVGPEPLRVGIQPGRHKVTVREKGFAPHVWEFTAASGTSMKRQVTLEKAEAAGRSGSGEVERPIPTSVWISGGATIALGVGGVLTGLLAVKKNDDFNASNTGTDPDGATQLKDDGTTLNYVADGLFVGAGVAAVVTTVLFLTRPELAPNPEDASAFRVSPAFSSESAGVHVQGRF